MLPNVGMKGKKINILGNLIAIKCFKSPEFNLIEEFLQPQLQCQVQEFLKQYLLELKYKTFYL